MKIVFLDAATLGDVSLSPIAGLGELVTYPTSTAAQALERVCDAEVLIVNKVKVTAELMDSAPGLKLICEAATGVNNIDLDAASDRGIEVRNVAAYSTESVVQITFSHIFNLMADMRRFDDEVRDGTYSRSGLFTDVTAPFTELSGKTIGIVGMGAIGQRVACVASALGMNVIYYSTSGTSHCRDYPSVSLESLLAESDVVSVHCPLTPLTEGLISAPELSKMKSGAIVVNMARGGIVDEQALCDALNAGTIAGAAVDVFTTEPLPADHPYLGVAPGRIRFTPHVGWASREAIGRLVDGIAENIRRSAIHLPR